MKKILNYFRFQQNKELEFLEQNLLIGKEVFIRMNSYQKVHQWYKPSCGMPKIAKNLRGSISHK